MLLLFVALQNFEQITLGDSMVKQSLSDIKQTFQSKCLIRRP